MLLSKEQDLSRLHGATHDQSQTTAFLSARDRGCSTIRSPGLRAVTVRMTAITVGMAVITAHVTVDGYLTRLDMASLVLLQLVIRVLHVRSAINMVTPL